jgi:hypothetical protein
MPKTIVINSSNYVQNSGNKFIYRFPNTVKFDVGSSIAVANISMYNSIQNITVKRGNNVLTLNWLGTDYVFTIPDGYYSVSDINYFLQSQMVLNGLYMTLNFYAIPTSAQATTLGYAQPSNATWAFPTTAQTPRLTFGQSFGNLLGMTFGTYPLASPQTTNIQILSTQTPVISPVDSLIMTCNLINSRYSIPCDVFFTIPISSSVGSLIAFNNSTLVYNTISPQMYSTLEVAFYSQLFEPVLLLDRELVLQLSISDAGEQR